jgi:HEPN domain-containing protein
MAGEREILLAQAEADLNAARNSLSFQSYDESIVSCYKALDKALHALCAFHHISAPPKGESIERLCAAAGFKPSDPAVMEMMEKAYTAKPEAIARDYAGERLFSASEAAQALRFTTDTLRSVRKRLKL